jgi:hypothetical protein
MASGNIHIGTMAGKLNGVMPATTPTGCRIEYESTFVETFSENPPFSRAWLRCWRLCGWWRVLS